MDKTILVIGSVTAEQYQPVRLELLREGYKPKIVRRTSDEIFVDDRELVERYMPNMAHILDGHDDEHISSLHEKACKKHFKHVAPGDTMSIVVDFATWSEASFDDTMLKVIDKIGIPVWYMDQNGNVLIAA